MTPQRARELLNQPAGGSKAFRSALLIEGADWDSAEWEAPIAAIHRFKEKRMTDQKELKELNNGDEDREVDDEESPVTPPQPQPCAYNSGWAALLQGMQHRVLLLKDGYEFDEAHSFGDVQPYELEAEGYPRGGAAIALTVTDKGRMEFSEVKFEKIADHAIVCGAIIYNECGLIAHLPVEFETLGEEVVLREERDHGYARTR